MGGSFGVSGESHLFVEVRLAGEVVDGAADAAAEVLENHGGGWLLGRCYGGPVVDSRCAGVGWGVAVMKLVLEVDKSLVGFAGLLPSWPE